MEDGPRIDLSSAR